MRSIYRGALLMAVVGWAACRDPNDLHRFVQEGDATTVSVTTSGGFGQPALPPGPTVSADPPPPPIHGGTLLVAHDGHTAIAADPDRDAVFVVDLSTSALRAAVALAPGDQPGRAVEDATGLVHVALRRGGAIATIDPHGGALVARRAVCPAPSGIAYDALTDLLHVACETGELVSIAPGGAAPVAVRQLGRDLRDVGVKDGRIWVSRFRSAEVLVLDPQKPIAVRRPAARVRGDGTLATPQVGWRMRVDGAVPLMLHQRASNAVVPLLDPNGGQYYGGGCGGLIETTVSDFDGPDVGLPHAANGLLTLATDFALSHDGARIALAVPGNNWTPARTNLAVWSIDAVKAIAGCGPEEGLQVSGEVTSVAFDGADQVVVQSREPAFVEIVTGAGAGTRVALSATSRFDTGLALFHVATISGVTCANCHAAGRDDGHVWHLEGRGPRRTQSLAQPLAQTAPYHWDGDLTTLPDLVHLIFEHGMSGGSLDGPQIDALEHWLFAQRAPLPRADVDAAAAARGAALFASAQVGCAGCHAGPALTNNATVDVGKGPMQVPSLLGVGMRTPLMHDGCAATLAQRFNPSCGGAAHGHLAGLTAANIADLVAYLESL